MDPFAQAASRIIKEQQAIIGPVALDQAKKVSGLEVSSANDVKISGNKKEVLGALVNQFAKLFGPASIAVCKEAMQPFADKIPQNELPDILKK
jgi:hypothetical protein